MKSSTAGRSNCAERIITFYLFEYFVPLHFWNGCSLLLYHCSTKNGTISATLSQIFAKTQAIEKARRPHMFCTRHQIEFVIEQ